MTEYFSELDHDAEEIRAAVASGTITPWRRDPDGVQWYQSEPAMIHGGPPAVAEAALDPDDDQADDDQDDDLEAAGDDEDCDDEL